MRSDYAQAECHLAIKVLHTEGRGGVAAVAKLRREFYCAQALAHPNIVRVFELDRDGDLEFFTMELIEGERLSDVMRRFQPRALPRPYAWALIRELGETLAHAHSRRMIHGDLQARKILVTNFGEVRILGFGASADAAELRSADPRVDLTALARLAYELLTGSPPPPGKPPTPAGLTRRQAKALTDALAPGQGRDEPGREVSVRDWLADMEPGSEALGVIPEPDLEAGPGEAEPEFELPAAATKPTAPGYGAMLAILAVACLVGWMWLARSRHADAEHADADRADVQRADVDARTASDTLESEGRELLAMQPEEREPAAAEEQPAADLKNRSAVAARPKVPKIGIAAASYRIRAGEKFAEIRVTRSSGSDGQTSFDWWTEPGSARIGEDYVPQATTKKFFLPGQLSASLFVRVYSNESGKLSDMFYVVIGNASNGSALGAISRTAVSLAPR
jgi:hypothetical protein